MRGRRASPRASAVNVRQQTATSAATSTSRGAEGSTIFLAPKCSPIPSRPRMSGPAPAAASTEGLDTVTLPRMMTKSLEGPLGAPRWLMTHPASKSSVAATASKASTCDAKAWTIHMADTGSSMRERARRARMLACKWGIVGFGRNAMYLSRGKNAERLHRHQELDEHRPLRLSRHRGRHQGDLRAFEPSESDLHTHDDTSHAHAYTHARTQTYTRSVSTRSCDLRATQQGGRIRSGAGSHVEHALAKGARAKRQPTAF